jgi:hypothetical protein
VAEGFFDSYERFYATGNTRGGRRLNAQYDCLIRDRLDLIRDRSILDIGSHDGRWGFAALMAGARHVTGIEPRQQLVDSAIASYESYGIDAERYAFRVADARDALRELRPRVDTVFLFGVLYHIHYHVAFAAQAGAAVSSPTAAAPRRATAFAPACGCKPSPRGAAARGCVGSRSAGDATRASAAAAATAPPPAPTCADSAATSGAGSSLRRLCAPRPRNDRAEPSPLCVVAPGSEVSPSHLPEHIDVERLLTDDPLQPRILFLQRLQPHHVLGSHRLQLRPPALVGLHRHLQVPTHSVDVGSPACSRSASRSFLTTCSGECLHALHETHLLARSGDRDSHNGWTGFRGSGQFSDRHRASRVAWATAASFGEALGPARRTDGPIGLFRSSACQRYRGPCLRFGRS